MEGGRGLRVAGSTLPPSLVLALETGWALRAREAVGQMNVRWVQDPSRDMGTPGERMKGQLPGGRGAVAG